MTLIYVPVYQGGRHRGTSLGPAALRAAELPDKIGDLGFAVKNEVEIKCPPSSTWTPVNQGQPKCVPEIIQMSLELAMHVESALEDGTIPITIGGDHSLAIGSIAGVSAYYRKRQEQFGVVWFDAHGDINTPETSASGNVHGMPYAVSLGEGDPRLTQLLGACPKLDAKRCALVGIRDVDPGELEIIARTGVQAFSMQDIDRLGMAAVSELALNTAGLDAAGVHLSFDIDVMDPEIAPGVSTPAPGGMTRREANLALSTLAKSGLVRSIDIAELNPAFDVTSKTVKLAMDLVLNCLGSHIL